MGALAAFLKKHTLWVGFLAVLLPLLVMLGVQFVWLARLEQVSAIAQKVTHNNYLEAIGTEVQFYYRSTAERALNIPATLFVQKRLGRFHPRPVRQLPAIRYGPRRARRLPGVGRGAGDHRGLHALAGPQLPPRRGAVAGGACGRA